MNVFTYWQGDFSKLIKFQDDWMRSEISITVLDDKFVEQIIYKHFFNFLELYKGIKIPACKSDVARLILLYEYGGMYVDAHAGPQNKVALKRLLNLTKEFELIVFINQINGKNQLFNGAMICRKNSKLILNYINQCIVNLNDLYVAERSTEGVVPYNLSTLTGAWILRTQIFEMSTPFFSLISPLVDKVFVNDFSKSDTNDHPFHFYRHYEYRDKNMHWSELQTQKKLFSE